MPKRIVIRIVNAENVSESRPQDEINAAITVPSVYGHVDVWLLCEIAWADLDRIAEAHGLHALHYGDKGSAEAGVGIMSRKPIGSPTLLQAVMSTREGGGIRMRPICSGRTYGLKVSAIHAHPARAPIAQAAYMARVRLTGGICGGDFNQAPPWMRRNFTRTYRGIGVLGLISPRRYHLSEAVGVEVGSDHLAVDICIEHRHKHNTRAT